MTKEWAHDISGWLMMPLALILVGLEILLLSWLVPEKTAEEAEDQKLVLPVFAEKASVPPVFAEKASRKKPAKNADLREL